MTACRLPLITNYVPNLESLYEIGKEIEVYNTADELLTIARKLIECPETRYSLAKAGYDRTLRDHTYEIRTKQLIDIIGGG